MTLRRPLVLATLTALTLLGPIGPALAHPPSQHDRIATPGVPLPPLDGPSGGEFRAAPTGLPAGGFSTDNVEFLGNIPFNADSAGARIVGSTLYVTDDRGLTTYDVSVPTEPQRLGFLAVPQTAVIPEEDVDTNGRILLIGSDISRDLKVIDVVAPAGPRVIGTLPGADSHTVSCVLDCSYAYNSDGRIIDLRDPTKPVLTGTTWDRDGDLVTQNGHDVTEVAPGIVVTSTQPMLQLDARTDPRNPSVTRQAGFPDDRYVHQTLWPRQMLDRWLLVGSEGTGSCDGTIKQGGLSVFDTRAVGDFALVDDFALDTGIPAEGNAVADQFCAHWFTPHPGFADGGLLAMSWYEHGTRFLQVAAETGQVTEVGWILPAGTSASSALWVTDEIVYVMDYQRGIDVLRFDADGPEPIVPELAAPVLLPLAALLVAGAVLARRRQVGQA